MTPPDALPEPAIEVAGLAVRRGARLVLERIELSLGAGEALLLRGPNGAGKTSLLLTLFGALAPAAGTIAARGGEPDARSATLMHFVGHRPAVKPRLTVAENLGFWARFNGGGGETIAAALERVGLGGLGAVDAGHLSAGQTRRVAVARLLVSSRPIWLLDEPTAALDNAGAAAVGGLIDAHRAKGGIVVAATHQEIALAAPARTLALGGRPS